MLSWRQAHVIYLGISEGQEDCLAIAEEELQRIVYQFIPPAVHLHNLLTQPVLLGGVLIAGEELRMGRDRLPVDEWNWGQCTP